MFKIYCDGCFVQTHDERWSRQLALLLADHCNAIATIVHDGRIEFRAAPTGGTL